MDFNKELTNNNFTDYVKFHKNNTNGFSSDKFTNYLTSSTMSFHIHKRSYYRYNKLVCPDKLLITIKTTGLKPSSVFCIYLNTLCPCKTMLNSKSIKLMVPSLVHTALPQLLVPHLRLTLIHNSYCTISMFQAASKLLPTCLRRDSQALGVLATQTSEAS